MKVSQSFKHGVQLHFGETIFRWMHLKLIILRISLETRSSSKKNLRMPTIKTEFLPTSFPGGKKIRDPRNEIEFCFVLFFRCCFFFFLLKKIILCAERILSTLVSLKLKIALTCQHLVREWYQLVCTVLSIHKR